MAPKYRPQSPSPDDVILIQSGRSSKERDRYGEIYTDTERYTQVQRVGASERENKKEKERRKERTSEKER